MKSAHDIRQTAWDALLANWQTPILATVILMGISCAFILLHLCISVIPLLGVLSWFFLIVFIVLYFPMIYAFDNALRAVLHSNKENAVGGMFYFFKKYFWRSLGGYMLVYVGQIIIMSPYIALTAASGVLCGMYRAEDYFVWIVLGFVFVDLVCLALLIIPSYLFGCAVAFYPFIMADHSEMSVWGAMKESFRLMKGLYWRRFVLDLTFVGWDMLSWITGGLSTCFVTPYKTMTYAVFYEEALEKEQVVVIEK